MKNSKAIILIIILVSSFALGCISKNEGAPTSLTLPDQKTLAQEQAAEKSLFSDCGLKDEVYCSLDQFVNASSIHITYYDGTVGWRAWEPYQWKFNSSENDRDASPHFKVWYLGADRKKIVEVYPPKYFNSVNTDLKISFKFDTSVPELNLTTWDDVMVPPFEHEITMIYDEYNKHWKFYDVNLSYISSK